jgi:membrane protease subunit HflK
MPADHPQPSRPAPPSRRRWLVAGAVLIAIGVYAASGFYFVQPDERGVVRVFGKVPGGRSVAPGMHYALPWPISRVDTPKTTEVRRVYVGQLPADRTAIARGDLEAMTASPVTDMLTGDNNILKLTMVVQYQVVDAVAYVTTVASPDDLVRDTVQAVVVERLAALPVDQALTTGKVRLQNDTVREAQARLDKYGCGVRLGGARLEAIEPPRAVADAFKDVVSAKKDGERVVDQAIAEANTILPRARGEAFRVGQEAEAYRLGKVNRATGESDRFTSLLAEYAKAPEVTRARLRLQAFERILPRVRVYVLDATGPGRVGPLKLIEGGGGSR